MKKIAITLLSVLSVLSCKESGTAKQSASDRYELEYVPDKDLVYPIDDDTRYAFPALFPYYDESGKEYHTFYSSANNAIYFYDLPTCEFLFNIILEKEGIHGVGRITGYLDSNVLLLKQKNPIKADPVMSRHFGEITKQV
ncbi:MAG: DUF4221 domain-containing protein [Tannerella sp.]|jgi:hypothetical protein|nr:DUF4221 domain-containing protein [Tannerella sp.]